MNKSHGPPTLQVTASTKALQSQLVNIPEAAIGRLKNVENSPSSVVVCLRVKRNEFYLGWSGLFSTPRLKTAAAQPVNTIELEVSLANELGIREGDRASVSLLTNVPKATTVNVAPATADDWEILELNAEYLETEFLKQCRAICMGQVILLWIRKQTMIRLRVVSVTPNEPVLRLDNDSEIIVAPLERSKANEASADLEPGIKPTEKIHTRGISARVVRLEDITPPSSLAQALLEPTVFLGVVDEDTAVQPKLSHASIKSLYGHNINSHKHVRVVPWKQIPSADSKPNDAVGSSESNLGKGTFHVSMMETNRVPVGCVAMSKYTRNQIGVHSGQRVRLVDPKEQATALFKIVVQRYGSTEEKITINSKVDDSNDQMISGLFREYLEKSPTSKNGTLILSSNTTICLDSKESLCVVVQILGDQDPQLDAIHPWSWATFHSSDVGNLNIIEVVKNPSEGQGVPKIFVDSQDNDCPAMGGAEKSIQLLSNLLTSRLSLRTLKQFIGAPSLGGILVHGNHGLGKSTLINHVLYNFSHSLEMLTYSHIVSCASLRNKKPAQIKDALSRAFTIALFQAPSILVLDDLDLIAPANAENADALGSRQIAEFLIPLIKKYCIHGAPGAVVLVATAVDKQSIHPRFLASHAIADCLHVSAPNRTQRSDILKVLLTKSSKTTDSKNSETVLAPPDTMSIASVTEGYRPTDLETLVSRAQHASVVRRISRKKSAAGFANSRTKKTNRGIESSQEMDDEEEGKEGIILSDLQKALEGFVPPHLKGLKMSDGGDGGSAIGWKDIGGLHEPKKMLIETLEWPTRYAAIFASCTLRLRSGILLYGYPGCGKTILAAAVAKECGLNFISVKGPEILNKYIGESEKSIRDLFDRAQSAKPCILFFDEFDSIAPRRGNDNTGVTDRVVNQLLTQMDGAEGLDGVYVLAATSRPDLIDPALLRPGRLDKSVLCGMPTLEERVEILEAVSRKLHLSPSLDLKKYAKKCDGFTGADLQGLIYSAQLEAIHERIDENPATVLSNSGPKRDGSVEFVFAQPEGAEASMTRAEKTKMKHRPYNRMFCKIEAIHENAARAVSLATASKSPIKNSAKKESSEVVIQPHHFEGALKTTRSSLTVQEKQRFDRVFAEFAGSDEESVVKEMAKRMGKKSTMA
ncbi:P-loop containing nucleoside triphosphate hydrolase protein [Obelidium mucronatum]|nr:P-loop containing nucleoside triphosphate hydrolase protein [Obelidium mucronatum]